MKISFLVLVLISATFLIFSTDCRKNETTPDNVTDIEGNSYKTVAIGNQVWMAENLKTTKFNDGSEIPLISDGELWKNLATPGYCWYNNDVISNKDTYGALYNGFTISSAKICPLGWRVPSAEDLKNLRSFLGDSLKSGGRLKETGVTHWLSPNKCAGNSSGFNAAGAGIRYFEGTFSSFLTYTSIWSASVTDNDDLWYLGLYYADASLTIAHKNKKFGFSVRCLKN